MENLTEFLQPGLVLASAVWAIATIKSTTEKLGLRIDQLGLVIHDLKSSFNNQSDDLSELRDRVTRLEMEK